MPKQICKNCRYQLEKTYYFRTKSKHSEAKLKKHIRLTNAGKESSLLSSATMEDDDYDDLIEMDQTMLESYVSYKFCLKFHISFTNFPLNL